MTPREELAALRRMAELEAKASGQQYVPPTATLGEIPGPRMTGTAVDQIPGYGGPVPAAKPSQQLTTGQKVYRTVRPVIEPTVSALASTAGALAGTPLGPAGIVGGAGLGYGASQELLKLGDIYLGGATPEEAQTQPLRNVLTGATFEAGGRAIGPALGYVGGKIADLRAIPQKRAATLAKASLGRDIPNVLNVLRNAPPGASVSEITASVQNPAWQALIRDSLESTPQGAQYLNKLATMTDDEAVNALAALAGGKTAADVRAVREAAKQTLTDITSPARQASLTRANLGQQVADFEAQAGKLSREAAAKVQEVRRLIDLGDHAAAAARLQEIKAGIPAGSRVAPAKAQPGFSDTWAAKFTYPGKLAQMSDEWASRAAEASLDLGQGAQFAQSAADSLRAAGIKPLASEPLIRNLKSIANNPEFAGNDLLLGAIKNITDDVTKWANSGGIIDAKAVDAIRKNSVNAAIQQLRPGMDATSQRNLAASVLNRVKPVLIDAIEDAGGKGYRSYLEEYTQGMRKIAEKQLVGQALDLYKNNKDAFVRLVQNESPETVEKILGSGKYNIAVELADDVVAGLQKQAQSHLNRVAASKQATDGQKALATVVSQNVSSLRLPSFLTFWAAAGNKTISELEKRIGSKTTKLLSDAMQDPKAAANLLEYLPPSEQSKILRFLNNPNEVVKRAVAPVARETGMNMLSPESENQNALTR